MEPLEKTIDALVNSVWISCAVRVPPTDKFPVIVPAANVGESAACNPLSTSVFTPFVASLIVPCDGLLRTEADTIPVILLDQCV